MYDVVIIGAGVSGSACARELSKYNLSICVVEKEEDVCCGTSKANSAIIHSGIDCKTGTLMAQMNLRGNEMMDELSKKLDFEFRRNGSLIVCFSDDDMPRLKELYNQGIANGVPGLEILDAGEAHEMEPNLSDEVVAAIYCPTGGIVCPFGMNIAFAENAVANGVEFLFNTEVKAIQKEQTGYILITQNGEIHARCVVNAAGVYADVFHNMVSENKIHITPRRGEYELLDRAAGGIVDKTIFQLPGKYGKGVLVTPTVHGNILIGPTADDHEDKDGTNTTRAGLEHVVTSGTRSVPSLPMRQVITSFAGNRAHEDGHEFIIEELSDAPYFVDCAGIESPGLSSAPAIGERVAAIVEGLFNPSKNADFIETRKGILNPKKLSEDEYKKLIKEKPEYGNIICRCEMITEGEIIDAVNRPLGAKSLDGVKRRTRAGMGRCQAGFCSPRTMEIIARERGISQLDITKSGGKSKIVVGMSKNRGWGDNMEFYDIVIVGGGPAGLAAAASAKKNKIDKILILERDCELGGILNQCIHNGFGLHTFKEELTGPEYAGRFIKEVKELGIEYRLNTMVMDISTGDEFENGADDRHDVKIKDEASDKIVTAMNRTDGLFHIAAKTVILAMGCRERARGALNIPGYRPAGIFSAGTAQRLVNIEGYMPGRKVVILGSGDIGLIMARRMTLEGAKVQVVAELMPYSGGLKRNIVQCLDDFGIPLKLSHTVVDIKGRERVEGITLAQVDEYNKPIEGTEEFYECDTLLLSCGLIPENEISKTAGVELNPVTSGPVVNESLETNVPGVFACGNVLHVHDLVDYVSEEATAAGRHAAEYVKNGGDKSCDGKGISITATGGVRYTVPSTINTAQMDDTVTVRFRVGAVYKNCYIAVYLDDKQLQHRKRPVMAPGEMEQVVLKKKELIETENPRTITIKIEEA